MSELGTLQLQRTGDIIFVRSLSGIPNMLLQTVCTRSLAHWSHVLLCVLPGLYVHAMPGGGVHLVAPEWEDGDLLKIYGRQWEVRRNIHLEPQQIADLAARTNYYIGQHYNAAFMHAGLFGERFIESHSFCSELIVKNFAAIGVPIVSGEDRPHSVLPVHLEHATRPSTDSPWKIVTADYMKYFRQDFSATPIRAALEELFPPVDLRPSYIATTLALIRSSRSAQGLVKELNAANDLARSVAGGAISGKKLVSMNSDTPNSFFDIESNLLEWVYSLDAAVDADEPSGEALKYGHFTDVFAEPLRSLTRQERGAMLEKSLRSKALVLENTLALLLQSLEQCVSLTAVIDRLQDPEAANAAKATRLKIIASIHETFKFVEDYDEHYDRDLERMNDLLFERMTTQPLRTVEARTRMRTLVRDLQLRQRLRSGPIRTAISAVEQNPADKVRGFEAFAAMAALCRSTDLQELEW